MSICELHFEIKNRLSVKAMYSVFDSFKNLFDISNISDNLLINTAITSTLTSSILYAFRSFKGENKSLDFLKPISDILINISQIGMLSSSGILIYKHMYKDSSLTSRKSPLSKYSKFLYIIVFFIAVYLIKTKRNFSNMQWIVRIWANKLKNELFI